MIVTTNKIVFNLIWYVTERKPFSFDVLSWSHSQLRTFNYSKRKGQFKCFINNPLCLFSSNSLGDRKSVCASLPNPFHVPFLKSVVFTQMWTSDRRSTLTIWYMVRVICTNKTDGLDFVFWKNQRLRFSWV